MVNSIFNLYFTHVLFPHWPLQVLHCNVQGRPIRRQPQRIVSQPDLHPQWSSSLNSGQIEVTFDHCGVHLPSTSFHPQNDGLGIDIYKLKTFPQVNLEARLPLFERTSENNYVNTPHSIPKNGYKPFQMSHYFFREDFYRS